MADPTYDDLVSSFCGVTGATPTEAQQFLQQSKGDVDLAVSEYYAAQEAEAQDQPAVGASTPNQNTQPDPPQKLPPSSSAKGSAMPKKLMTLNDLKDEGDGDHDDHGHDHGDGSDDDYADPDDKQDFFAGGEKSGLAVQNPKDPRDHIKKIIEQAKKNTPRGDDSSSGPARRSHFSGTGQTLGGDDTPSEVIPDPNEPKEKEPPFVKRTLMIWNDGFSVDDGPLYEFSNPENRTLLEQIQQGRAPLAIMNVEVNQPVEVSLMQMRKDYEAPKKQYKPFGGSGHRLGSPTPGDGSSQRHEAVAPAPAAPSTSQSSAATIELDPYTPQLSLQVRLGDGTRLTARFNTTHTIEDVYSYVNASNTASASRQWTLMTTFPSKELTDKAKALGDVDELKRGGVVVQKWL